MKKVIYLLMAMVMSVTIFGESEIDKFITKKMEEASKPGMAVAVVREGKVEFLKGYGMANLSKKTAMSENTPVTIASVSKLFVAIAVAQQIDAGKIDLDEDINLYLPFKVRNPKFPDKSITVRMLMTHTSGIKDNWFGSLIWKLGKGDPKEKLGDFIEEYFKKNSNMAEFEPGTEFKYNGMDICLLAYIIENISGKSFEEYCEENIFNPLEMKNTSWFFSGLQQEVAMPYEKFLGLFYKKKGWYSAPFYPMGFLKTTSSDMANFLIMIMGKGNFKEKQIVSPETLDKFKEPQNGVKPDDWDMQGLVFQHKIVDKNHLIGHTGGLWGIASLVFYSPEKMSGVIMLTNGGWVDASEHDRMKEKPMKEIFFKLLELK